METRRLLPGFLAFTILTVGGSSTDGQAVTRNGPGSAPTSPAHAEKSAEPLAIAEGEYTIFKEYGGIGPVDAEIFDFREDWSISRTADGNFEVEGNRSFESPQNFPREIRFSVRLSPELQFIEAREDTSLVWIPRSAPLSCVFLPKQLECSSGGKDRTKNPAVSLSMDKPYAFSWPLSAFSLAALTRRSDHHPGRSMDVQFVDIEQPSSDLPLMPITTNGTLRFIDEEKVTAAGSSWEADKFELQAFMSPLPRKSMLWVSKEGLLLILEAEREIGPKGRLELTHFKRESPSQLFP